MRKVAVALGAAALVALALTAALLRGSGPGAAIASSHREAPLISEDPTADNTDLYAFRSPDQPNTLTIVANWIPGEDPAAGPNYYTFSQTARYNIHIDRNGDGKPDVTYSFHFKTPTGPFFLGNTQQTSRHRCGRKASPCRFAARPRSTTSARATTPATTRPLRRRRSSSRAAARSSPASVTIRSSPTSARSSTCVAIRKAGTTGNMGGGKDFLSGYNVHSIVLQIPISLVDTQAHTIGVWSSTDRHRT